MNASDSADAARYASLRTLAAEAAVVGGGRLLEWRGRFETREKGPADLVTDADFASQQAIRDVLMTRRPDDVFVGEESDAETLPPAEASEPGRVCWVVDPLDGTVNYVHGVPAFATSVAAVEGGRVVAGAIFDPLRAELYTASLGGGAWLADRRLSVSECVSLTEALVAISLPPGVDRDAPDLRVFLEVAQRSRAVRRSGSAALNLAYAASGRFDAHWAHAIMPWDAAAGVLLASEAGARVTAVDGGPFDVWRADYLVAATDALHAEVRALLG